MHASNKTQDICSRKPAKSITSKDVKIEKQLCQWLHKLNKTVLQAKLQFLLLDGPKK